ncbi:hypothetical protein PBT90_13710 [Algoriphagus halophytocola]|uniref:Uncharacterized protein n=1 Tax=Algoriphagus halophytocola TaxID=2991499 RepID=A0ABY6MMQ5_9BACT|nr:MULTISPECIES: hypothetical protein [unclassified Algoriphagus]UZD24445.1 hypothetical protein OM944_08065 [Algoriphagus sp. TR-M5]WBL41809.1 hypothetical protein PBT90_13710 [Algoriphagus sp. TR-M9]
MAEENCDLYKSPKIALQAYQAIIPIYFFNPEFALDFVWRAEISSGCGEEL